MLYGLVCEEKIGVGNLLFLGFLMIFSRRIRDAFLEEVTHRARYERLARHYEQEKAKIAKAARYGTAERRQPDHVDQQMGPVTMQEAMGHLEALAEGVL